MSKFDVKKGRPEEAGPANGWPSRDGGGKGGGGYLLLSITRYCLSIKYHSCNRIFEEFVYTRF